MRILFVEDKDGFARDVEPAFLGVPGVSAVVRVKNKSDAEAKLRDEMIDLIILDLSIPPNSSTNVHDLTHGQALFHHAREVRPGTPIFILTGEEVLEFSRKLAQFGNQVRLWGNDFRIETVNFFPKEEVSELVKRLTDVAESFIKMNAIAINTRGKDLGLTPVQEQMLKSFANSADCVACDVSLLSGGLSDAKVVKATAVDKSRNPQAICAGKLGPRDVIQKEKIAYERHGRKLGIGACPHLYYAIDEGVGMNGGIFYSLTDEGTTSLFDTLDDNPDAGPTVIDCVKSGLTRWSAAKTADMVKISEIRRRLISDVEADNIEKKFGIKDLRKIESRTIQANRSCIHGDLHCGNILVKRNNEAVLIDFGDAAPGFTALDPIALELSLVFHPDAKKLGLHDDLLSNLDEWRDVEKFAFSSAFKPTIVACREWAHDVGGGDRSIAASAYAYAFRQLKYETVAHDVTIRFIKSLSTYLAVP